MLLCIADLQLYIGKLVRLKHMHQIVLYYLYSFCHMKDEGQDGHEPHACCNANFKCKETRLNANLMYEVRRYERNGLV